MSKTDFASKDLKDRVKALESKSLKHKVATISLPAIPANSVTAVTTSIKDNPLMLQVVDNVYGVGIFVTNFWLASDGVHLQIYNARTAQRDAGNVLISYIC